MNLFEAGPVEDRCRREWTSTEVTEFRLSYALSSRAKHRSSRGLVLCRKLGEFYVSPLGSSRYALGTSPRLFAEAVTVFDFADFVSYARWMKHLLRMIGHSQRRDADPCQSSHGNLADNRYLRQCHAS